MCSMRIESHLLTCTLWPNTYPVHSTAAQIHAPSAWNCWRRVSCDCHHVGTCSITIATCDSLRTGTRTVRCVEEGLNARVVPCQKEVPTAASLLEGSVHKHVVF